MKKKKKVILTLVLKVNLGHNSEKADLSMVSSVSPGCPFPLCVYKGRALVGGGGSKDLAFP